MSTKRGRFFSSIGETISRSRSTRRFRNVAKSPEFDEGKFRNRAGSHLEEAEQQRIMIGNLVKTGKLSIEEAMQFAEVTGLTENKDPEENMTYNFGVYKHTKDRSRTEKCILQFDFNEQVLSTITKGKFGKNVPFSDVRDYDSEDGVRFILYLDDGEVEYDADDPEEKNKICNLLDGIVEDNKNSQYSEYSGYGSLPRARHSTSTKKLLKEGQIEKRGHSAAFLTWSKRYLRISEGELAYYKVGEEHMTALNLIKLGPGHAFIKKLENNGFVVSTQKKEYSFRVVNTNNSKDAAAVNKERDEWFDALTEGVQPSFPVPTTPIPAKPQSPAYAKQDLLSTALDQEEYLKKTVESLQKELEQLMSIMNVVQAPVQATSQMKKVQEIVKTLDVQIKTGLLAWTMKSVVAMNCILPNSSTNEKSSNKQHGIEGLFTIPESSHGAGDIGAGHTTTQGIASHGTAAGGVSGNTAGISSGTTLPGTACSVQEHGTTTSTSGASGDMAAATVVPGHTSTSSKPNDAPGVASNNEMVENHAPSLQGPTAFPFPDQTTPQPLQPKTSSEDLSPPVPPYAPSSLTSPFSPPPPPLPGIGGVPTPPPFGMVSPLPAKPLIKPNVKVRPFYWAKVPDSMVLSSMWGKAKDRVDEIDLKMIDELFRVEEKPGTPDLAQRSKKIAPKSLMDNKRAQNLGIFLSGFKLTAQDVDRKLDVIDDNDGGLPLEVVIALKRFQPTTEESEMYKNYKGDKEALPKTDQFMIKVCEIPNLTARLDLLLFILEFPLQYDELSPTVTTVLESCNEILQNDKFNVVMEYILAIGNYLNGSTNRGAAHGFKIASLPKLVDTRGRDKNYTLMSLLVDMLSVKEGETLSLHEDMKSVKHAAEASVKGLKAEVEVLWKGLAKIKKLNTELQTKRKTLNESDSKFHEDINIFVSEYEMRLLDLNKRCDDMKEKYAKLLVLLGEPSSKSSEEVFGYLNKFLAQFSAAVKEQTKANSHVRNNNRNNNQTSIKGGKMSFKPPALSSDQAKLNQMIGELKGMQATSTKSLKRGKSADSLQVTSPSKEQEQSPSKQQEQPPSKGQEQPPSKGQEQSPSTGQEQPPSKGQEQSPSKGQEQSSSKEQEQSQQPPPVNRTKPAVSKPPAAGKTSSPTKRPTRQGVLDKLSGGKHKQPKWDTRYFELDDSGHLHYFKKAEGKVVNSIYLRGAPVSIDEDDRCLIKIQTEDRTFQIRASNATEAVAWKNDLSCYT